MYRFFIAFFHRFSHSIEWLKLSLIKFSKSIIQLLMSVYNIEICKSSNVKMYNTLTFKQLVADCSESKFLCIFIYTFDSTVRKIHNSIYKPNDFLIYPIQRKRNRQKFHFSNHLSQHTIHYILPTSFVSNVVSNSRYWSATFEI
jgi:hypothetical protein